MKLTVDLASKFSAAVVMDLSNQVLLEFSSVGLSAIEFAEQCAQTALDFEVTEAIFEDVPHGITGQGQVKPPFRLQGIVIDEMAKVDLLDRTFFLDPSMWMKMFEGVAKRPKGTTKTEGDKIRYAAARAHAHRLGYSPPPLVQNYIDSCALTGVRVLKKNTDPLYKTETDHIDAFLMGVWANSFESQEELRSFMDVPFI
jgi:hypothetical protein